MAPLTGYRRWFAAENQMRANSWMLMVGALGMVTSTLPVQWLLPLLGWRPIFVALAVLVVVAMVVIAWQVPKWESLQSGHMGETNPTSGYSEVWRNAYFRRMVPLGFFNYGGLIAIQTLWATPWMVKVGGYTPLQAATGLFGINVAMLVAYWAWGAVNPWLARNGFSANRLIAYGLPISILLIAIISIAGSAITAGAAWLFLLYCVASTVVAMAQPAVAMAFPSELAGRALSAYNLVLFLGVFVVQWGIGLLIDALRSAGWGEPQAYQGALGVYGVCCFAAYVYFLLAKKT
jgi:predicted MFS family arabinose efflux permease